MNQQQENNELFAQREVFNLLELAYTFSNKQKLTYLRLGRKQWQLKRDGRSEYFYHWTPQLKEGKDWFYQRGKVIYTMSGVEKLKIILKHKLKIYINGNDF